MPKISELTADTAPTGDDLVPLVNDPSGTPGTRKATLANLAASAPFSGLYAPLSPITVPANALAATSGSPSLVSLGVSYWAMDPSSIEGVHGVVSLPPTWNTYNAIALWDNAGAGTGDVSWRLDTCGFGAAASSWASFTNGVAVVGTAGAQNVEVHTTLVSGAAVPAGGELSFRVFRLATAGGDTLANDAGLAAVRFVRAS